MDLSTRLVELARESGLCVPESSRVRFSVSDPVTYVLPGSGRSGPHLLVSDGPITLRSTIFAGPTWGFLCEDGLDAYTIGSGQGGSVRAPRLAASNLFVGDRSQYLSLLEDRFEQAVDQRRDANELIYG